MVSNFFSRIWSKNRLAYTECSIKFHSSDFYTGSKILRIFLELVSTDEP